MNIVVASAGTARWWSAGLVPWELLWPLCAGSVPAAFAGGAVVLPAEVYRRVLAVTLLGAALRLWFPARAGQLRPAPGPGVLVAGLYGSWLGARRLPPLALRRLLAAVLLIAGGRLARGG